MEQSKPDKGKIIIPPSTNPPVSPTTAFHHSFLTIESNNNNSGPVVNPGGSLEYVFPSRSKVQKQQVKKEEIEWKYDFLPELPSAVLQMYWLEKLTVTYCNLEILSPKIANLQMLKCLVLDHNHLKWLPPEIGFLTKLELLFFRGNGIPEIPAEIGDCKKLRLFYASGNQIVYLPTNFGNLTNLREIDLARNNLEQNSFPDSLSSLTSLEILHLEKNDLQNIPSFVAQLSNLKELQLENSLTVSTSIDSLSNLRNLTKLYLSSNELTQFPNSLIELPSLQALHLQDNAIVNTEISLPKTEAPSLKSLFLGSNQISILSPSICGLTLLKHLNLESNQLEWLPFEIGALLHLKGLNISNNKLESIPESLCFLPNLEFLHMSYNRLKELPSEIGEMEALRGLDIDHNQLVKLPESMGKLRNVGRIVADSNFLKSIPTQLLHLDENCVVSVSNNKFPPPLSGISYLGWRAVKSFLLDPHETPQVLEINPNSLDIGKKLGEGGYGEVYAGKWSTKTKFGKLMTYDVAIKILTPRKTESQEKFLENIRREIGILKKTQDSFSYPGSRSCFIEFYGACTLGTKAYIVTKLAERTSLRHVLKRYLQLDFSYKVRIARQVAEAMLNLHSFIPDPILHHDLKTTNILVMEDWSVRLTDYGLSRFVDFHAENATLTNVNPPKEEHEEKYTVAYIPYTAPEVLLGKRFSTKADVFSFGIVLYEIFVQHEPFEGNYKGIKQMIIEGKRPSISTDCPPLYSQLMQDCWDQNAANRPDFQEICSLLSIMQDTFPNVVYPSKDEEVESSSTSNSDKTDSGGGGYDSELG